MKIRIPLTSMLLFYSIPRAFTFSIARPAYAVREKLSVENPLYGTSCRRNTHKLNSSANEDEAGSCWNPKLRRSMGIIAGIGAAETGYLTFTKLTGSSILLCGTDGACGNVLNGPYGVIPGTDVPLALLGFVAYMLVGFLAVAPFIYDLGQDKEENNRLLLTAASTTMGVFSVFLMTLLFGVLGESCNFCVASAIFSVSLAKLAWLGGAVPAPRIKQGIKWSAGGGLAAFMASAILFTSVPEIASADFGLPPAAGSTHLLASSESQKGTPAPPILSKSSPRALGIATDLESLDSRMFGAYWCSHCYDQKERLGKEAMLKIPYIECSRDGLNSQNSFCKERGLPGYPTWEINGKLYPGEKELDELEEIIKEVRSS
mmetsp:Transcript_7468/g.9718  ORF Transcript_7468/g.9718 Transcript_7468/m.9718 type:complete len:374 (-) Transcript_7468:69-1190(-)|eukprot:CAMPEP_0198143204 /NCGR_PEP_ID=MMETSP1443-20131203/6027_1 /TAXON_ID=186043 /ORGANISM="Entomoneis sp., Strain CCMP2396" /LENGTH=373 /DNA_ID=CAMNT_0043806391 /DNA_START=23 /DNA_END=1144 /DNA_ORIENTATION=+